MLSRRISKMSFGSGAEVQSAGIDAEEKMYTKEEGKKSGVLSSTLSEGRRRS